MSEISILEIADPTGHEQARHWMKFIRTEITKGDVSVLSLRLEYLPQNRHQLSQLPTNVCASYCRKAKQFSISREDPKLGPGGYISVDPGFMRGKRLGSFLMWQVVTWGQQRCPDYTVNHLRLNDMQPAEDLVARDRLYARMGVPLGAQAEPVLVEALTAPASWMGNINMHDHNAWLREALAQKANLAQAKRDLDTLRADFTAYRSRGLWKRLWH